MRFDPEDYAFIAHYDRTRLVGEVKNLGKQGLMRLLSLGIAIVIVVIIWRQSGNSAPATWFPATRYSAILLGLALLVTIIVLLVEKFFGESNKVGLHVVMLACLLVAAGLLLPPIWLIISPVRGYSAALHSLVDQLNALGQSGLDAVKSLLTTLDAMRVILLVCLIVGAVVVLAAAVLLVVWLMKPRSPGWAERKVLTAALWLPPCLLLACCLVLIFIDKYLVPHLETELDKVVLPSTGPLPTFAMADDWILWLLLAGLLAAAATFIAGTGRLAIAAILLARLPSGNALRVDPLGMVLDDVKLGPQRVPWPAIDAIAGRPRQALPGPELVIGRPGQSAWAVPFMFLDVLPGTIDSAVRAHTHDARELDLTPLDRVV